MLGAFLLVQANYLLKFLKESGNLSVIEPVNRNRSVLAVVLNDLLQVVKLLSLLIIDFLSCFH